MDNTTTRPSRWFSRVWLAALCLAATLVGLPPALGQTTATFPVSRSSNGRYLVEANGRPFPIFGRTAWFITSATPADYQLFIDDCVAKGYNTIEFHVLNHDPRGHNPPFASNGTLPFTQRLDGTAWTGSLTYTNINTQAPDFSHPNEAYWTQVDALLSYAQTRGILCMMFPAYVGYPNTNQGWMAELVANGATKMQSYGAFIAARYANRPNIVWMMGGDMGTFTTAQTAVEQALLTGLLSVQNQQSTQFSAEWTSGMTGTEQPNFGGNMTLNSAYNFGGQVPSDCRRAYSFVPTPAGSPFKPTFLLEEPYDQEGPDGNNYNPSATQPVRRFQWWGVFSGIGGYVSGNGYVWPFNTGWQTHLNTQCAQDMGRLNAFQRSIAWNTLVPSGLAGTGTIVTAGGSVVANADYVAAAASSDGTLLVAYVPPAHTGTITINMARLSGPSHARWFNPTTAAYTEVGIGLANTGTRVFTPPGNNGSGYTDWVLLIQTTPRLVSAPPSRAVVHADGPPIMMPVLMGETRIFRNSDRNNQNQLLAQDATLSEPATIERLSIYVNTAAGNIRLGLYDASGPDGGPGALMAQTDEFAPIEGWNTEGVIEPVSLPQGKYWLAFLPSRKELGVAASFRIGSYKSATVPFGPLPAAFPEVEHDGTTHWSFHATGQ